MANSPTLSEWLPSLQSANEYQKRLIDAILTTGINPRQKWYLPRGAAMQLFASTLPEVLESGPTRTGKSLACLAKLDFCARHWPASRHLIVRKTRTSLTESGLVTFERDVLGLNHPLVVNGPSKRFRHSYPYDNGSEIVIGGLDKPGKVLSSEYDTIYVQQAEEISETEAGTLTSRLASYKVPFQQLIMDCNPGPPSHWLYKRCQSGKTAYFEGSRRDNPMLWDDRAGAWTEKGEAYRARMSLLTGTLADRLNLGLWVQAEGVVFQEFTQDNITDDEPDLSLPWELAIDDGYVHPRAILFIQQTGTQILVFKEFYHTYHLAETCVGEVVDWCKETGMPLPEIAITGSESKELQQRLRRADITARGGTHGVAEGIEVMRRLICDGQGYRALKVHRRCKNFIAELTEGYRYPSGSARGSGEMPVKESDDACDAGRMWCWMRARRREFGS